MSQTYIRQECGIVVIVAKQGSDSTASEDADKRNRIIHFRQFYLFHNKPAPGAPVHATEINKKIMSAKVSFYLIHCVGAPAKCD